MELETELIRLIRNVRNDAWYNRCNGRNNEAQVQEEIANAMERTLWNCNKVEVPIRKGDSRGVGITTRLINMYGVFRSALQSQA